jgi:hypothetical protein
LFWGLQKAQLAGTRYCFGPTFDLQLAEYSKVVPFDRVYRQVKPLADLVIRKSLGDEAQHFQFTLAQWVN